MSDCDNGTTIKTRLSALIYNKQTLNAVRHVVIDFNVAAKAAWLFARWIFLAELEKNPDWDPASCINQTFSKEVLLACIECNRGTARSEQTVQIRKLIAQHEVAFREAFHFTRPTILSPQQLCLNQATKMVTAYSVNIKLRLGNYIRHHINCLDKKKHHAHLAKKSTKCSINTKRDAKAHVARLNQYVESIKLGKPNATDLPKMLPVQQVLIATFTRDSTLPPQGLWYDISANPIKYFKTMIDLNRLNLKTFQVFPISTSWKPLYVTFDLKIIVQSALGMATRGYTEAAADPDTWWAQHVRTNKRPWKAQSGRGHTRLFQTDGVAVSVYKSRTVKAVRGKTKTDEERQQKKEELAAAQKRKRDDRGETSTQVKPDKEFSYITDIEPAELRRDEGNTVLIDPGRGDLLYCMHEHSTPTSRQLYRYTADQRRRELKIKQFRDVNSVKEHPAAKRAMVTVSKTSHRYTSVTQFTEYLAARSAASEVLTAFFTRKVHREIRWQSFRLQQQSDARLSKNIRQKFGEDPLLVIGDHTFPNLRFQQPIRGVGMLRMLRRHKFRILLVDEHNTSKICPGCDQVNRCFRWRCNPRPWRQDVKLVHGLKQCDGCRAGLKVATKPWNRDLVATLNFRRIVVAQREDRPRPEALQRKKTGVSCWELTPSGMAEAIAIPSGQGF